MSTQSNVNGRGVGAALAAAVTVTALLRIIGVFLADGRMWGIDIMAGIGLPAAVGFGVLAVLVVSPVATSALDAAVRRIGSRSGLRIAVGLALALAAATLLLPMSTFFYGDGSILMPQVYRIAGALPADPGIILNVKSAPLAGLLLRGAIEGVPWVARGLSLPLPTTGFYPFTTLSLVALIIWAVAAIRSRDRVDAVSLLLVGFGSAGALFFFSYVEFYALAYACIGLYLLMAARFIRGEATLTPVVVAWGVAVAAHYMALALLPSLLWLVLMRVRPAAPLPRLRTVALSAAGIIAAFVALELVTGLAHADNRILAPFTPITTDAGTFAYTLPSGRRMLDLVNMLLLVAPVPVIHLSIVLPVRRLRPQAPRGAWAFLLLATVFLFAFLFFSNLSLGLARDWDVAAPFGLALTIAAWWVARMRDAHTGRREALALGLATVLLTIPWLWVNIQADRSAERFERIVQLDDDVIFPDYALSGYEALRKHHQHVGNAAKDLEWSRRKIELLGYEQDYSELIAQATSLQAAAPDTVIALHTFMLENLARKAEDFRSRGVTRDYAITASQIDRLAEMIAFNAYINGQYRRLEPLLARISAACPGSTGFQVIRGLEAYRNRDYARAIEEFQIALDRRFLYPVIYGLMGSALGIEHRYSEAFRIYEKGVETFPEDPLLRFVLAQKYIEAGIKLDVAVSLLQSCRASETNADKVREIDQLLQVAEARLQSQTAAPAQP